jgi:hypothetical protein
MHLFMANRRSEICDGHRTIFNLVTDDQRDGLRRRFEKAPHAWHDNCGEAPHDVT